MPRRPKFMKRNQSKSSPVIFESLETIQETEQVVDPVVEPEVEPVVDPVVEPVVEADVEPVVEADIEAVVPEPVVEPVVVEAVVEEPVVEADVEAVVEPVVVEEPVVEAVVEAVVEEPVVEADVEAVIKEDNQDIKLGTSEFYVSGDINETIDIITIKGQNETLVFTAEPDKKYLKVNKITKEGHQTSIDLLKGLDYPFVRNVSVSIKPLGHKIIVTFCHIKKTKQYTIGTSNSTLILASGLKLE